MSLDEKIRLAILATSVIAATALAVHFGHIPSLKLPFLDEIGGGNST
jgi:hypothetical protein